MEEITDVDLIAKIRCIFIEWCHLIREIVPTLPVQRRTARKNVSSHGWKQFDELLEKDRYRQRQPRKCLIQILPTSRP